MKVMIDTNIIISAILFPQGKAALALQKCLTERFSPVVCDYIIDELMRKFGEKFPDNVLDLKYFLSSFLMSIELVPTSDDALMIENLIRDEKDRPIIRAAINCNADLLLTGDKDFLESHIEKPRIISVADFLAL